jgi:hypothetical protein
MFAVSVVLTGTPARKKAPFAFAYRTVVFVVLQWLSFVDMTGCCTFPTSKILMAPLGCQRSYHLPAVATKDSIHWRGQVSLPSDNLIHI